METYWVKNKEIGYGRWNLYKIIVFLFGRKIVKYLNDDTKYVGYDLRGYDICIGIYHREYHRGLLNFILSKLK